MIRIMNDLEFAQYKNEVQQKVFGWGNNGCAMYAVLFRIIGYIEANTMYAFTGAQLKELFDLAE